MSVLIVCIGNRHLREDALGPRVLERLRCRELPAAIALWEGGIGGLDLLPIVERASHVVFVDAVLGAAPSEIVELEGDASQLVVPHRFGHDAGLSYLLGALPYVCDAPPSWELVGADGAADDALVEAVAAHALELALCRLRAEAAP